MFDDGFSAPAYARDSPRRKCLIGINRDNLSRANFSSGGRRATVAAPFVRNRPRHWQATSRDAANPFSVRRIADAGERGTCALHVINGVRMISPAFAVFSSFFVRRPAHWRFGGKFLCACRALARGDGRFACRTPPISLLFSTRRKWPQNLLTSTNQ